MATFDTVIKNGTIVDGTRVPRYKADIGIKNGKIAQVGRLNGNEGKKVLDANGLIVAPGFIDLHTHYDAQIHWDPYCSISCWHGVTSVTIGNCGFGFAPLKAKDAERAMLALSRNEAIPLEPMKVSMKMDWETFPQYMDRLSRMPLGINLSHLVPVSPLVAYVMGGFDAAKQRFPNAQEMEQIIGVFKEAMDAGAVGWAAQRALPGSQASIQNDYDGTSMISDLMPDEFYLAMAKALRETGRGFIEYAQASASATDPTKGPYYDFQFTMRIAEESGQPVVYNAILISDKMPGMFMAQLQWLEEANAKGIRVFGQTLTARVPFRITFDNWNLFDDSPTWREATLGTVEEKKAKLSNAEIRKALRAEQDAGNMTHDYLFGELPLFIARKVQRPDLKEKYEGLSVQQIAEREGKHVIDALLDLSVADNLLTEWETPIVNENPDNHKLLMSSPYTIPGLSDGGAHIKFITPGTYSTDMLAWMVRDAGILSLEEAHFRLSALPAWAAQFKDRGTLREGQAADIVVYDLEKLKVKESEIAYDLPANEWRRVQKAEGYRWTMVNGEVTFENGQCTNTTPGKLLRHGRAAA
jgi:N-acyl-D-amino-acid deacylase